MALSLFLSRPRNGFYINNPWPHHPAIYGPEYGGLPPPPHSENDTCGTGMDDDAQPFPHDHGAENEYVPYNPDWITDYYVVFNRLYTR